MSDLLPANASQQERDISLAIERAGTVPVVVREMWNPDTCPASHLPWLAWALTVDTWDASWTDAQKRAAIKASVAVHQRKGTIGALRTALDALGYEINVTEWFQKTPVGDPYTFSAQVVVDQIGIPTANAYNQIVEVANNTKNLRSKMTGVDVLAKTNATEYFAARCYMGEIVNIQAEPSA